MSAKIETTSGRIKIFNQKIVYAAQRDESHLFDIGYLAGVEAKIKSRVIFSLLPPQAEIKSLYEKFIESPSQIESAYYIFDLYEKICQRFGLDELCLVAVLRSGLFLAEMIKYLFAEFNNLNVKIIGFSPNYIAQSDWRGFKNELDLIRKKVIFVDGWISNGVTYAILKKFWQSLFPGRVFQLAVIQNIFGLGGSDVIYSTAKDVLTPWSIFQTEHCGLSNYFINPVTNQSCAFYLSKSNRIDFGLNLVYQRIFNKIKHLKNLIKERSRELPKIMPSNNIRKYKFGLNECIKSLEKRDAAQLFLSKNTDAFAKKILLQYAKLAKVGVETTTTNYSFVIKTTTQ